MTITLSGKEYSIRFDLRALKEYKGITGNDILQGIVQSTENIIALAFTAIKSGHAFEGKVFDKDMDFISSIIQVSEIKKVIEALQQDTGMTVDPAEPGEVKAPM